MPSAQIDDPYLWLEDIDGPDAIAWVETQNEATIARLRDARFEADQAAALSILDANDRLVAIRRRGRFVYNFWTDASNPRGLWRRTTLAAYRTDTPAWEIMLDLDALCVAESESWVWNGCETLAPDHDRGLIMLSRGGADAVVVREFDLTTKSFVGGGFVTSEAKTGIVWLDRDNVLIATTARGATTSGYARAIHRWHRGQALDEAACLFEGSESDMAVWVSRDDRMARTRITRHIAFWKAEDHVFTDGAAPLALAIPLDATADLSGDLMTVSLRSDWLSHPAGSLIAIGFQAFAGGDRTFVRLFDPGPRRSLKSWLTFDDHVVLNVLDDLDAHLLIVDPTDDWVARPIPGLPRHATLSIMPLDLGDATGDLLIWSTDFLDPPTMWLGRRDDMPEVLDREPARFDASGLTATRHDAIAEDGTRIPYFQIGPADAQAAFTRLYGYGGFAVSMLPTYMPVVGKLWLEPGHVYVMACLRGGGEFGPAWHKAGQRERKIVAQDDFAAIARDLVRRGVTTPSRLAAEGGSNGGLLIGNMLTRHPTLFGALSCQIPLLDMERYTKLLAGASWVAEYGDPDVAEDWAFLKAISAYQNIEAGQPYPPILFTTTRRDDRVHPGHARKMAAAMQAQGYEAPLFEQKEGGHGTGADQAQRAFGLALGLSFIRHALGMHALGMDAPEAS